MEWKKRAKTASPRKRLTAFVMTLAVVLTNILTNILTNASIVALASGLEFPEAIFGMTSEELREDAQYALESGGLFETEELGLESGSAAKAYKKLVKQTSLYWLLHHDRIAIFDVVEIT